MVLKMPTTMSGTMGERMRDHRPLNLCKGSLNQEPLRFFSVSEARISCVLRSYIVSSCMTDYRTCDLIDVSCSQI